MINIIQTGALLNPDLSPVGAAAAVLVGLSTDSKPTGLSIGNGWMFIEMDTSKIYFYNAAGTAWVEFGG